MCPLGNIVKVSITANTQSCQHILLLKMKIIKDFIKYKLYSCLILLNTQIFHDIHHVVAHVDHVEVEIRVAYCTCVGKCLRINSKLARCF